MLVLLNSLVPAEALRSPWKNTSWNTSGSTVTRRRRTSAARRPIRSFAAFPKLEELPIWGFDGSSTQQAEGRSSDCMLKPVAVYPDATRKNGALVMCEVMMPDARHPASQQLPGDDSGRPGCVVRL